MTTSTKDFDQYEYTVACKGQQLKTLNPTDAVALAQKESWLRNSQATIIDPKGKRKVIDVSKDHYVDTDE